MLIGRSSNTTDFPGYWSDGVTMLDDQGVEVYLIDTACIWTDGDNVYYDDSDNHYKLINNYNPNINAPR